MFLFFCLELALRGLVFAVRSLQDSAKRILEVLPQVQLFEFLLYGEAGFLPGLPLTNLHS